MRRHDPVPAAIRVLVGSRMARARERLGLTQAFVADCMTMAGYAWSRDVVAKIESGERRFLVDELVVLLTVLPFDARDLLPAPVGTARVR